MKTTNRIALVALLVLAAPLTAAEFQVNTYTTGRQAGPFDYAEIASAADGKFVVAWTSDGQDGSGLGVFAQRFTAAGVKAGVEFQVSTRTADYQFEPHLAMEADGDFLVIWTNTSADDVVDAQRFSSAGTPLGAEFQVSETAVYANYYPQVVAGGGGFVVAWATAYDGDYYGVMARRLTSSGALVGGEFLVNSTTTGYQIRAKVAADAAGNFTVVWESSDQDGDSHGIFAQRYDSSAVAIGAEFQINSYTTGKQLHPQIAMEADGDFMVAWASPQDGENYGIFGRRFNSGGTGLAAEFQVNNHTPGDQERPSITVTASGYVVNWNDGGPYDGDGMGVFGRRFTAAGVPVAVEFQVNSYTTGTQGWGSAAVISGDGVVFVYADYDGRDGDQQGVFARFDSEATATPTPTRTNTPTNTPTPTSTPTRRFPVSVPIRAAAAVGAGGME